MTQVGAAIVTGASRGIGRAVAQSLAQAGYPVLVNFVNSVDAAEEVVQSILQKGGRAVSMAGDVSQPETAVALFDRATEEFGAVDVLINNAGVSTSKWLTMAEIDDDTYNHVFDVNTRGTFNMLREASLRLRDQGRIVNFSSSLVIRPFAQHSLYTASKAAVESFTRVLAKELGGRKITVNCISPGATTTEVFLQGKSDSRINEFVESNPLQRLGTPEDIASVVTYLVSTQASWINGQIIAVNGGSV